MEKAVFLHQQYYKVQPQLYAVSAFASLVAIVVVVVVVIVLATKSLILLRGDPADTSSSK